MYYVEHAGLNPAYGSEEWVMILAFIGRHHMQGEYAPTRQYTRDNQMSEGLAEKSGHWS